MPSDQSTWLIAVPQDGDSEGLLPEITSKLPQLTRVAELGIPSFKVLHFVLIGQGPRHLMNRRVDRDIRLLDRLIRGAAKTGRVLHSDCRKDCGHPPQPAEQ
jgi:hypothetical protein